MYMIYLFTNTLHIYIIDIVREDNMDISQQKRRSTVMMRYGVDNVSKLPTVQDKRRATFATRCENIIYCPEPAAHLVDAFDLTLYKLNKHVADEWLNKYHPLKAPKGNILCLGLVKDAEIYCLMTFKKSRDPQYVAELSRMWTLPGHEIIGGYDVLSSAASSLGLYNIVAYVKLSFENVEDYESIGMQYSRSIQRTRWWIHNNEEKMTDASRRQRHLSETDMINGGWRPTYDCGQSVYIFK